MCWCGYYCWKGCQGREIFGSSGEGGVRFCSFSYWNFWSMDILCPVLLLTIRPPLVESPKEWLEGICCNNYQCNHGQTMPRWFCSIGFYKAWRTIQYPFPVIIVFSVARCSLCICICLTLNDAFKTSVIKNWNFKKGIGIAEKSYAKQEGIAGVVYNVNDKSLFCILTPQHACQPIKGVSWSWNVTIVMSWESWESKYMRKIKVWFCAENWIHCYN